MKGQVLFFPLSKCKRVDFDERIRLDEIQDFITGARNEMQNRTKDLSLYWQRAEKIKFHGFLRSQIKLVKNG